jgi:hypothetical protein
MLPSLIIEPWITGNCLCAALVPVTCESIIRGECDGIDKAGMVLQDFCIEENQEGGNIAKGRMTSEGTHKEISPFVQDQPSRR